MQIDWKGAIAIATGLLALVTAIGGVFYAFGGKNNEIGRLQSDMTEVKADIKNLAASQNRTEAKIDMLVGSKRAGQDHAVYSNTNSAAE